MDTCQIGPLCKQRQNKVIPYFHIIHTLTHLPKGLLPPCSIALGWLLVLREPSWMPDPMGAQKLLGLTETNYSLPSASS